MQKLLLIGFILLSLSVDAQPVITRNSFSTSGTELDLYQGNSTERVAYNTGENQVWDLSSMPITFIEKIVYSDNVDSRFKSEFPLSNLNYEVNPGSGNITYLNVSENRVSYLGFETSSLDVPVVGKYDDEWIMYSLPLRYNDSFSDEFSSTSTVEYNGEIDHNFFKGEYSYKADGYGKLITPFRVYPNVLRVTITTTGRDSSFRTGASETTMVNSYTNKRYVWLSADDKWEILTTFDFKTFFLNNSAIETSVKNEIADNSILIFPNPVADKLQVNMKNIFPGEYSILIYDNIGNVMRDIRINSTSESFNFEIPLANLSAGFYLLKVVSSKIEWNSRFIKQ